MTQTQPDGLVAARDLAAAALAAAAALRDLCNREDGLDLKVQVESAPWERGSGPNRFLYWQDGALVGFAGLDEGGDIEVCGMVHPAYRRRGIGRALLDAARSEARARGKSSILLIGEDASPGARALAAAVDAPREFAEHHMELQGPGPQPPAAPRVEMRRATLEDIDALTEITAAAFGDPEEFVRSRVTADLPDPQQRFYVGWYEGRPVGSLKVYTHGPGAGIYAFGVRPADRGKGLGRAILTETIRLMQAEGRNPMTLEVETANTPAVHLYESCGFATTTTYGYYRVETGAR
jgi:mycothiol synthase